MKISILIKILKAIFLMLYLAILVIFPILQNVWFSIFLIFVSILLNIKATYFKYDSKLWLGSFLFFNGAFNIFKYFEGLKLEDVYMIYILIFGIASLHVFVVFRQKIHLKVFVFSAIEVLLLGILKFTYFSKFEFWYLQIMFLVYTALKLASRLVNNFRR